MQNRIQARDRVANQCFIGRAVDAVPNKQRTRSLANAFAFAALALPFCCSALAQESDSAEEAAEGIEFFETHIRPVLIESCLDCHSSETEVSGGLSLDSRAALVDGGDSGAAVDFATPAKSLLLKAISYSDPNLQMPPDERLSDQVVVKFKQWVELGAPDPRQPGEAKSPESTALTVQRAQEHWAYRPVDFENSRNLALGIDDYVNAQLNRRALKSTDLADQRTLLRRLYFDLTGLPPTHEDVQIYMADATTDKYERLVERLLTSPAFGENFARRWMDVARYAESITLRGFVLPNAWRYRDWLIDAYNHDLPLDEMIRQQIAGDLLPSDSVEQRAQQVVATGFLAMGNTNLEQQDKEQLEMDYIDEQLEVIGRAFLGQTIGCARCHDHKFDPIPTRDYYALAGILRSTKAFEHDNVSKWIDSPLPLPEHEAKVYDDAEAELKKISHREKSLAAQLSKLKAKVAGEKHVGVETLAGIVIDNVSAKLVGSWTQSQFIGRIVGEHYIHAVPSSPATATFEAASLPPGEYEVRVAYSAADNRSRKAKIDVFSADGQQTKIVNQRETPTIDGLWHSLGVFRFEQDGQAYVMLSTEGSDGHVIADAVQFLPQKATANDQVAKVDDQAKQEEVVAIEEQLAEVADRKKKLNAIISKRPKYLTVRQTDQPTDVKIHVRGNVHTQTETVPRGVLTALDPRVEISVESSGRLELANWIASPQNPLTARVYANRVWGWLMGRGLVASPNNFGTTGFAPSHPELLDFLAVRLVENGWSTKDLVRLIVLSDAYKRSVADDSENESTDPDNQFYWRAQQRRLTVEMLRDSMLMASGELELTRGGKTIRDGTAADYSYKHEGSRRSVYQPVLRNSLPPLFEVFDFADPSASIGKRPRSTVATQALALRNNPWVLKRAEATAERLVGLAQSEEVDVSNEHRWYVHRAYEICLQRSPTPTELDVAVDFLASSSGPKQANLTQLVHAIFCSLDFRFPR